MPTPIAHASSTAVVISSRYDMLPSRQLLRGGAECLVAAGIARHRAEQMTVQLCDEAGERCASPVGQARFSDVFSGRLRCVEPQRLTPLELEDKREEPMAERFGVAARAGELLGECEMRGGIRDHRRSDGGSGLSGPRGWLHDSPHDVPEVHEHHDEGDDEDPGDDVEADWML